MIIQLFRKRGLVRDLIYEWCVVFKKIHIIKVNIKIKIIIKTEETSLLYYANDGVSNDFKRLTFPQKYSFIFDFI